MIDGALYTILSTNAAVAAIVADRIYPTDLPQEPTFPAVAYSKISDGGRYLHHKNFPTVAEPGFQFDCLAATPLAAKQLADAVRKALHGYTGTVGSDFIFFIKVVGGADSGDAGSGIYQVSVDAVVRHRET